MIIVMGVPGAGKSTVLNGLDSAKTGYKIVNYGDLMLDIERKEYGIQTRDDMRKLPIEKQKHAQRLVAEALAKMPSKVLLDTHCSVSTPSGYYPGIPFEFLKLWKVEALVYITADVKQIQKRRKADQTRIRDSDDIELHDKMNLGFLSAYSAFTGAPAVVIFNEHGKADVATAKLQSLLLTK